MKQLIVVRTDLKMGKGKLAAQVAHASLLAFLKAGYFKRRKWLKEGMKKIVVKVKSKEELIEIYRKAKNMHIPCEIVRDAGLTQIKPGTITALGIGPEEDKKIDKITRNLKLL